MRGVGAAQVRRLRRIEREGYGLSDAQRCLPLHRLLPQVPHAAVGRGAIETPADERVHSHPQPRLTGRQVEIESFAASRAEIAQRGRQAQHVHQREVRALNCLERAEGRRGGHAGAAVNTHRRAERAGGQLARGWPLDRTLDHGPRGQPGVGLDWSLFRGLPAPKQKGALAARLRFDPAG